MNFDIFTFTGFYTALAEGTISAETAFFFVIRQWEALFCGYFSDQRDQIIPIALVLGLVIWKFRWLCGEISVPVDHFNLFGREGFAAVQVRASDDEVGSVRDFYFDDEHWAIRYLVVDTGAFFSGRRVLVSPVAFRHADWSTRQFHLALTRERVKDSPNIDLDKPVSRQYEREYFRYYGWPYYWGFDRGGIWGGDTYPSILGSRAWSDERLPDGGRENGRLRLRGILPKACRGFQPQGPRRQQAFRDRAGRARKIQRGDRLLAVASASPTPEQGLEDVFWAVMNSREFMFNH